MVIACRPNHRFSGEERFKAIFKHLHMCLDLRLQRPHSLHAPHRVVVRLAHLRQVLRVQQVELGQDLAIEHVGKLREDGVEDGDTTASQSSHDLRLARSLFLFRGAIARPGEWAPDAKLLTSISNLFGEKSVFSRRACDFFLFRSDAAVNFPDHASSFFHWGI